MNSFSFLDYLSGFDLMQIASAFIVLFAIIDPLGSLPIVLNLKQKGEKISSSKVTIVAFIIMLCFVFAGKWILDLFGVDVHSFAVAGSIILFLMALEMVCDLEIFKNNGPEGSASIVPLAFPLFAGPGVFTSVIALQAEFATLNIVLSLFLNMIVLYFILRATAVFQKMLGESGIYVIRKFFGVILLAISVKLFVSNIPMIFN